MKLTSVSCDVDAVIAGVVILLKYPYPCEVSEPVQYDSIKVHAQMGRASTESDKIRLSVSALQSSILTASHCFILPSHGQ